MVSVLRFRGICQLVWNTLTSQMNLLEQDQGYLLARSRADKRAGMLCASSVKISEYFILDYFTILELRSIARMEAL